MLIMRPLANETKRLEINGNEISQLMAEARREKLPCNCLLLHGAGATRKLFGLSMTFKSEPQYKVLWSIDPRSHIAEWMAAESNTISTTNEEDWRRLEVSNKVLLDFNSRVNGNLKDYFLYFDSQDHNRIVFGPNTRGSRQVLMAFVFDEQGHFKHQYSTEILKSYSYFDPMVLLHKKNPFQ